MIKHKILISCIFSVLLFVHSKSFGASTIIPKEYKICATHSTINHLWHDFCRNKSKRHTNRVVCNELSSTRNAYNRWYKNHFKKNSNLKELCFLYLFSSDQFRSARLGFADGKKIRNTIKSNAKRKNSGNTRNKSYRNKVKSEFLKELKNIW